MALDQWYTRRQKDGEGDFYRKIVIQVPYMRENNPEFKVTTQGLYMATADGKLLGYTNHRDPARVKLVLRKASEDFEPAEAAPIAAGQVDAYYDHRAPKGARVVTVTSKVLAGHDPAPTGNDPIADIPIRLAQESLGRDNLWILKHEQEALARGQILQSLKRRIALFHLVDITQGIGSPWDPADVRELELTLSDGKVTGKIRLESAERTYRAEVLGFVDAKDGALSRFDWVARGSLGKLTIAHAFRLSAGTDEVDRVPPGYAKVELSDYLR